eukprot:TRINITY_DN8176_c0_g1_i1.p1 TRINITY_DN8176_c0_g1~~TRINITY_DN8176_c0_g1_i1.p1  ORF type:complete len:601 (+),score=77.56 TRINITY_DN8176_c0_g1_i1:64-1866(+)
MIPNNVYISLLGFIAIAGGVNADGTATATLVACDSCCPLSDDGSSGIPLWISVSAGIILLCLSGCFSGLTLGLMGLDSMALRAVAEGGQEPARSYAQAITPIRKDGNLLLCTLLLGNVMVNVMIPILLADLTNGLVGFAASTIFIVVFGEIVPQATCSRYALYIGAKSIPLVSFFMFVLYLFAKPIALVLDKVLGRDAGQVYDKSELKQLLWQHLTEEKLEEREYQIVTRGLDLQKTEIEAIMTPEDKIYKLDIETMLTMDKLLEIWQTGHSRIPVVERVPNMESAYPPHREEYIGILYTKDLITCRVEDRVTVRQVLAFYNRGPPLFLDKNTKLDDALDAYKKRKTHMSIVTETISPDVGDPHVEVAGIATLEDLIEQLVGEEIVDEHDTYVNIGASRMKKTDRSTTVPLGALQLQLKNMHHEQALAVAKFLQYSLSDPFSGFSESQIVYLLNRVGIRELRCSVKNVPDSVTSQDNVWLYKHGRTMENFTMVLSGRVEVISGSEGFRTELGPNQFVGVAAIQQRGEVQADFDCRILSSPLRVLQMTYSDLEAAKAYGESTDSERAKLGGHINDSFSDCDTPILERKYSNPIAPSDVEIS